MLSESEKTPAQIVGALTAHLSSEEFGTGPRAALRRLDPHGALTEPALHRLLARHVPETRLNGRGLQAWSLIIHALALAAPDKLRSGEPLGAELQKAGLKETRFVNLLDADANTLPDLVLRAVRFLVSRGGLLHGPTLADLILSVGNEGWAERVRQRIARDYYRAEARVEAGTDAAASAA